MKEQSGQGEASRYRKLRPTGRQRFHPLTFKTDLGRKENLRQPANSRVAVTTTLLIGPLSSNLGLLALQHIFIHQSNPQSLERKITDVVLGDPETAAVNKQDHH